jgi:hypothetical protein
MISTPDRQNAMALIDQATAAGARRAQACAEPGIDERTCRRWRARDGAPGDRRPMTPRPAPGNKLSEKERWAVLDTCNSPAFKSLPPSQVVPWLADAGRYLASEASLYRILRAEGRSTIAAGPGRQRAANQPPRPQPLRGLELGHPLDARPDPGRVLLAVPHPRHLQMGWTAPNGINVPRCGRHNPRKGAVRHER